MSKKEKKICFVVTPIDDENSVMRRHIEGIIDQAITPAIEEDFEIKVAHREYDIGSINDRVIQSVYNSDLVIANLTALNPNVMFELAIRYSFGKPAIVIAEKGTRLPFDIVDENTIFYINDPAGAAELKGLIAKFVDRIDWKRNDYGPIFSAIKSAAVIDTIETQISGEDDKNAFSFIVDKISNIEYMLNGIKSSSMADFIVNGTLIGLNDANVIRPHTKYYWYKLLKDNDTKLKVYEVAKYLDLTNKEILNILNNELGFNVKSHMSEISVNEIFSLVDYMNKKLKVGDSQNNE